MFLHLSVILFTGGCLLGGYALGRHPPARQPPLGRHPSLAATAAGGTHPTGMHSCSFVFIFCFHVEYLHTYLMLDKDSRTHSLRFHEVKRSVQ